MSRTAPVVEPAREVAPPTDLIPLSHFALDHPEPAEGWSDFLGRQGITLRADDIGRDSIRRSDAQVLLHEQRAEMLRAAKRRQLAEAEAVEADKLRRSQIWTGVSADLIPVGVRPAEAMLQASKDAQPRRRSMLEESLARDTLTFHSYAEQEAG